MLLRPFLEAEILARILALALAVANLAFAAAVALCLNAGLVHALFTCSLSRRRSAGIASILALSVAPPLIAPSNLFSRVVGFRHDSIMPAIFFARLDSLF